MARKKAAGDVATLRHAFPAVQDVNIVLAMASWFALLCAVDDDIESMAVPAAQLTIEACVTMLEGCAIPQKLQEKRKETWEDHLPYSATGFDCDEHRTIAVTKAFLSQLRGLLPARRYGNFIADVVDVFQAMASERAHRELGEIDENMYFGIRVRTVGLQPFFVLLSHTFNLDSCEPEVQGLLATLERDLALAIGLQNDILGLSKDIEVGETFNFVLLDSRRSGADLPLSLAKAVRMHNAAIQKALACWKEIEAHSDPSAGLMRYASTLLGFATRHFNWASRAERYGFVG